MFVLILFSADSEEISLPTDFADNSWYGDDTISDVSLPEENGFVENFSPLNPDLDQLTNFIFNQEILPQLDDVDLNFIEEFSEFLEDHSGEL